MKTREKNKSLNARETGEKASHCSNDIKGEDTEEILDTDLRGLGDSPKHLNVANNC